VTFHPTSEYLAIIDNPEELNCGADYSRKRGSMGIEWGFGLLIIDAEWPLINAYSIYSNQNWLFFALNSPLNVSFRFYTGHLVVIFICSRRSDPVLPSVGISTTARSR